MVNCLLTYSIELRVHIGKDDNPQDFNPKYYSLTGFLIYQQYPVLEPGQSRVLGNYRVKLPKYTAWKSGPNLPKSAHPYDFAKRINSRTPVR